MEKIIEHYKQVVIQIATPYSTGTGFYSKEHQLIITNEHVVRDNREVLIDGVLFDKQLSKVIFIDAKHDLAFLEAPKNTDAPAISFNQGETLKEGQKVTAIGHPFNMKYSATQGIVSNPNQVQDDIGFIHHDAALNPGNSGGPLIDIDGNVVGVNTFIIKNGNNIGFSLPTPYLLDTIAAFRLGEGHSGARCLACSNVIFINRGKSKYCPDCGAKIVLPTLIEAYEPFGVPKTIEDMISTSGHEVAFSRRGPNNWEIGEGSAHINISYHEQSGLIIGDAYLCCLPKQNVKEIYVYLLKQNYEIEGLTFSVKGRDIVLSLLIYDRYLNVDTGVKLFNKLFAKADYYDNILVEEYGALWKKEVQNPETDIIRDV